uniref:Putative secreted protein n=1 Tax=Ixodes ricinus TaxID=34613 RepID=V5GY79_IXORI
MLPAIKVQLVVFAVVLILPALQSEELLSGAVDDNDCMDILTDCGEIECPLHGSGTFEDYNPHTCTLECAGNARPKVPSGVCSGDVVTCNSSTRESLRNWRQKLQTTKTGVLKSWCPSFWKK